MVSKTKKESAGKKKKIKVLTLDKETVKDLTNDQTRGVRGGIIGLSLIGGRSGSALRSREGPEQRSRFNK